MAAFVSTGSFTRNVLATRSGVVSSPVQSAAAVRVSRRASVVPKMSFGDVSSVQLLAGGMEVTFPAYLAIFLGTLIPVAFLIILFIQSEARKAGAASRED
mmetsp:Transcript_1672/g.1747  ORF Transcript_1672/g.1747 Transcript_1672/m.1747 type:complete len:100 (+) Transcript_1672:51-350(+)|eukprot:CAMPEP_0182442898 /NCGR_PEP_ID=MMETSP1172-20130603/1757_1 /TAXON_ID=708627 /ORGANISM="Timspurckia oligopyrenoides, Strain CCMP3278" /LENGTH=99 /DNA_ID=CAMNT_0024637975 /DNA_START=50 /DNA_END=349 /DNA_ORIENTATION=-